MNGRGQDDLLRDYVMSDDTRKSDVSVLLENLNRGGDESGVLETLQVLVEKELRGLAGGYLATRAADHSVHVTMLVHEAYARLFHQIGAVQFKGKKHFFVLMARAMQRILIDHARRRNAERRGGNEVLVSLNGLLPVQQPANRDVDLLELNELIEMLKNRFGEETYEIVMQRFFCGMTVEAAADALGISKRTVHRRWEMVRTWLFTQMSADALEARQEEKRIERAFRELNGSTSRLADREQALELQNRAGSLRKRVLSNSQLKIIHQELCNSIDTLILQLQQYMR